jgi:hypothetical protein
MPERAVQIALRSEDSGCSDFHFRGAARALGHMGLIFDLCSPIFEFISISHHRGLSCGNFDASDL